MSVYAIGGKVQGIGKYIGSCSTRLGLLRLAGKARKMGATGLSVHGMGLSGEVSLVGLDRAISDWQRMRIF